VAGDDVCVDPDPEHAQSVGQVVLGQRDVELRVVVSAEQPDHEDVEPSVLAGDPVREPAHLYRVEVVDAQGGAAPDVRELLADGLDRLRPPELRGPGDRAAAARCVDVGSGAGELHGDLS
jgi:hypothetical protein